MFSKTSICVYILALINLNSKILKADDVKKNSYPTPAAELRRDDILTWLLADTRSFHCFVEKEFGIKPEGSLCGDKTFKVKPLPKKFPQKGCHESKPALTYKESKMLITFFPFFNVIANAGVFTSSFSPTKNPALEYYGERIDSISFNYEQNLDIQGALKLLGVKDTCTKEWWDKKRRASTQYVSRNSEEVSCVQLPNNVNKILLDTIPGPNRVIIDAYYCG